MNDSVTFPHTLAPMLAKAGTLLLLVSLASCGCRNAPAFDDVLQSECDPPCWRGIVPGVTTRDEVIELLDREPEVNDPSYPRVDWGNRCIEGGGVPQVEIRLDQDDAVVSITLAEAGFRYTFGDAVKEHGPPSSVMVNECSPESNLGYVYLVYHEEGVAFATGYVPVLGKPWQQPSARERVYQWIYFAPTSRDRLLLQEGTIPGCGLSFYSQSSEWLGFGR
jgi:hypothetical protein